MPLSNRVRSDAERRQLAYLKDALSQARSSEDVEAIGLDALRDVADADPDFYKSWKSANPRAYVAGQPMVVNDTVFSMRPLGDGSSELSPFESQQYVLALEAQARKRMQQGIDTREEDFNTSVAQGETPDIRSHVMSQHEAKRSQAHNSQSPWLAFGEAFRALGENSGRSVRLNARSLGLPTSVYDAGPGQSYLGTLPAGEPVSQSALNGLRRARSRERGY